jgi:hypothetical protein
MRAERRRDADDQRVAFGDARKVGRRLGPPAERLRDAVDADVPDVRLSAVQLFRLFGIDVEAERLEAALFEQEDERQADVAESDDADRRGARFDRLQKRVERRRRGRGCGGAHVVTPARK